jgi:hypothetical protein
MRAVSTLRQVNDVHPAALVTYASLGYFLDMILNIGLAAQVEFVVVGGFVDREKPPSPPDRHIPFTTNPVNQRGGRKTSGFSTPHILQHGLVERAATNLLSFKFPSTIFLRCRLSSGGNSLTCP